MSTISKTVQQRMERFWQKQMQLDKLTQQGWGDVADYFHDTDQKHSSSSLRVPAVVEPQSNQDFAAPAPTTLGELIECLHIVPRILQMPQGTTRPESCHMRLGSANPKLDTGIPGHTPAVEIDSSRLLKAKPIEPVSFYPCTMHPQPITM